MEYADLFININEAGDLFDAATIFFKILNISSFNERESSNYLGGSYVTAEKDFIRYDIANCDDDEFNRYRFWVSFEKTEMHHMCPTLDVWIEELIKNKLLPSGITVARVFNYGKNDMNIVEY